MTFKFYLPVNKLIQYGMKCLDEPQEDDALTLYTLYMTHEIKK